MMKQNNKGFTLIEIMVIVVILAVLMAIAVPSVLKYADEGDKAQALDDAYACVSAAKYYGVRSYVNNSHTRLITSDQITKRAGVEGELITYEYNTDENTLNHLIYNSLKGIMVEYDGEKYEFIDVPTFGRSVIPILQELKEIASRNPSATISNIVKEYDKSMKEKDYNTVTKILQDAYKKANNGQYKPLSETEKNFLISKGLSSEAANKLYWKPMLDSYGNIFLCGDSNPNATNSLSTIIYTNNSYFYHTNGSGPNHVDSHFIGEGVLKYDDKNFPIPNQTNPGKWYYIDEL